MIPISTDWLVERSSENHSVQRPAPGLPYEAAGTVWSQSTLAFQKALGKSSASFETAPVPRAAMEAAKGAGSAGVKAIDPAWRTPRGAVQITACADTFTATPFWPVYETMTPPSSTLTAVTWALSTMSKPTASSAGIWHAQGCAGC